MTTAAKSLAYPQANTLVHASWLALIWGMILVPIIGSLTGPGLSSDQASSALSSAVLSGMNFAFLGFGLSIIVFATRYPKQIGNGMMIWLGAMALSIGPILSALLATESVTSQAFIRIPLFFTAAFLLPPVSLEWFTRRCKSAIECYAFITLAALVIAPGRVMQVNYDQSVIDAWTFRLHGIAGHANSFGPLLAVYLLLGWIVPAYTVKERCTLAVVIGTLLLTQSKTTIMAIALMYIVRYFYSNHAKRLVTAYAAAVASVTGILLLSIYKPTWDRDLVSTMTADDDLTTLTGRTELWDHSLNLWRQRPVLGLGPEAWHLELTVNFLHQYGWAPYSAHNQVLQTLGESGIIGLLGLIMFLGILVTQAIRFSRITHGATLALVILLLVSGVTEVPISRIINEKFFILFLCYSILLLSEASTRLAGDPLGHAAGSDSPNKGNQWTSWTIPPARNGRLLSERYR